MSERFAFLQKLNPDDLLNQFLGLERKQQTMVLAGIGVLIILLLMIPSYFFTSWLGREEEEFMKYQKSASEFFSKASEYGSLNDKMGIVQKNLIEKNASLKVVIEKVAKEYNMGTNIKRVTDMSISTGELFDEVGVDTSMAQVPLDGFLKFVEALEQDHNIPLKISKLMMRADPQNKQILKEASFVVSTIRPKPKTDTVIEENTKESR